MKDLAIKQVSLIAAFCAATVVHVPASAAEPFPSKPIRAIVPFTSGSVDTLSRTLGEELARKWGQPVVVDNRPGAGATIGTAIAAKAPADGYTWLMVTNPYAIGLTLYPNLSYSKSDFEPVSLVATTPMVMAVNPSVPAASVREFISLARANPGGVNFASAGVGSATHVAGELFARMANIRVTHVPYKGSAPAVTDLIGGRVQMIFDPLPSSLPHIRSGKFKPVAVTSRKRSALLPDVETFHEGGVQGYDVYWWAGIVVPAGTPRTIITQMSADVAVALRSPALRKRFGELGYDLVGSSPEQLASHIESEISTWAKVIQAADLKPE